MAADVAVIGRVVDYRPGSTPDQTGAKITVQTIVPLRGGWTGRQTFVWINGTFGQPDEWRGPRTVFIAGTYRDAWRLRGMIDKAALSGARVLQRSCGPAHVFGVTTSRSLISVSLIVLQWLTGVALVIRLAMVWQRCGLAGRNLPGGPGQVS